MEGEGGRTMGRSFAVHLLFPLLFLSAALTPALAAKSYVVFLKQQDQAAGLTATQDVDSVRNSHYNLMASLLGSEEKAQKSIIYSYSRFINGFAAVINDVEAAELAKNPNVLSMFPNRARKLHTTRTWQFLGLEKDDTAIPGSTWEKARFGEDTIIANLDTGVWPESASFNDEGMGPIPSRWKGTCQQGVTQKFPCNRKLIGAKAFFQGYVAEGGNVIAKEATARDTEGHGSHTLSTAGGSFVPNVNLYGFANGTAKGGSPRARIAAYKVCWPALTPFSGGCFDSDILAGFEAAIADGVDVISLSLGGDAGEFAYDSIAIGSFYAVSKGITVVASGGNSGPFAETISNVAPWIFTVAASTMDRDFPAYVALGNRAHLKGTSFCAKGLPIAKFYPLISSKEAKLANTTDFEATLCKPGTLDPSKVKGKILICLRGEISRMEKGQQALLAGAVGMILVNNEADGNDISPDPHVLPASHISYTDGLTLFAYYKSTTSPTAFITKATTELGTKTAPIVAVFSSRGPNAVDPAILKPDITAPGVDVLAAYTQVDDPSIDPRPYILMSGTSMSCPHVSGIVGLIKTAYPNWTPAAIRSAIMTTAVTRDNKRESILDSTFQKATPFDYGAGHVQPSQILDPGLVYDLGKYDYVNYLCGRGYNVSEMAVFNNEPYTCPAKFSILNFNYPSITVPRLRMRTAVTRRVTNVGQPGKYVVRVKQPAGVTVAVRPSELVFERVGEVKEFKVVFKPKVGAKKDVYVFGTMIWSDGKHNVRSPLVVKLQ